MPFAPSQKNWDNTLFPKLAYAWAITMALLPSAVVRAGTSDEGIPIGVQVVANPWREDVALAAAKIIEHANLR
jgi:amidase